MAELSQTTNVSDISGSVAVEVLPASLVILQQVIDHLPGAVSWQDRNLIFQGCNRAFAQAVGLNDPSEIVGKSQQEIRWANCSSDFLQVGDRSLLEQHQTTYRTTLSLPSPNGHSLWLDIHKTPLYDAAGTVIGVISSITDITTEQTLKRTADQAVMAHQQATTALSQTETRFQTLLANVPGMLFQFIRHPKGIVAFPFVSPGCLDVFELSPAQIEADANLLFDLVQTSDRRTLERSIAVSAKTLQPWYWEGWFTLPSGKSIFVKGSARPEQQTDGAILWSGFLLEATRRKRAEDSLQRAYDELEQRVEQRTAELAQINQALQAEIREHQQADMALQASEARLRALVENLPFDFWANDADGYYIMQNRIDMENWGNLLGKRLEDLDLPPAVMQQWQQQNARLFAGEVLHLENSYEIDGQLRTFSKIMAPVWDGNEICGTLGANIEITEQKRAEAAVRQNEERLRLVLESMPVMMDAFDENGNIIMWNSECERVTGYSASEIIGNPQALELLYPDPDYRSQMVVEWARLGNNFRNWEWQIGCKDGSSKTILWSNLSEQFPIPGWAGWGIGIDISDRKRVEDEQHRTATQLRESQQILQLVINTIPQAIFWKDRNLVYLGCNRNFAHAAGLQHPDAIIGKTDYDLPWKEEEANFYRQNDQVIMTTNTPQYHVIKPQLQADGREIWCDTNKMPLHDADGNVVGILGTFADITERQEAEAALRRSEQQLREQAQALEQALQELKRTQTQMIQSEKMSSLGQLVAGVAHEINNPVNFIYGNLNHASDYIQDLLNLIELYQQHYPHPSTAVQAEADAIDLPFLMEDLPKLLASMRVGTERIRQIVLSLRNFSRMDEAEMKTVDIHEGIDSTLMILQNRLKAKGSQAAIEVAKTYGNLPLVECYPGQLNQVFMNILSNAIDALEEAWDDDMLATTGNTATDSTAPPQHGPMIRVSTGLAATDRVHIIIADNGLGIPETKLQQLFDPFFTTKPVGKGTGLGLSISYQIITEKHKGELWCVSTPGQGAEFHIKIPIQQ